MQEPANEPGLIGHLFVWGTAFVSWASGEVGKVIIAGAAGGFLRWFLAARRKLIDGVFQIAAGAVCAHYLQSIVLAVLNFPFGEITDRGTAGFIAGMGGVSLAKIIIAVVEARARSLGGDSVDDKP